jgi:hypothetical protein
MSDAEHLGERVAQALQSAVAAQAKDGH